MYSYMYHVSGGGWRGEGGLIMALLQVFASPAIGFFYKRNGEGLIAG